MPPLHLLIKPSSGMCNMRCTYCFYHDITEKREQESYGFMSLQTMERIVEKAIDYADNSLTIAFQGGEPTLIGLPFYRAFTETVSRFQKQGLSIHYAIQTNGYKLDEDWAAFLSAEKFLVGISIDGTIHTHDQYRRDSSGHNTFLEIMKTVDLFQNHGVEYNILTVVNKKTASSIRKIYQYYKKMGFGYLQFIPCLDPLDGQAGTQDYSLTPQLYGNFLCELFDLWYDDFTSRKPVYIRQFENYISILLTGRAEACDMNGMCSIQHVVEADGEVYPCDFYVLDEYKLGNLNETSFEKIQKKRLDTGFLSQDKAPDPECRACTWFPICRGGCHRHRDMAGGDLHRNYFCESYQQLFRHALPRMQQVARMMGQAYRST